ncbi:MAG: hypothetical protein HRT81_01490 [Henriciella sp.]|nr:hypothetical protein [Henriciella sp.]
MTATAEKRSLDDVLVAMDVVDTLRHRDLILQKELDQEGREQQLITRLREIYAAQGIEVTDEVLLQGVQALEEQRFHYRPPAPSLGVRLAKIYVSRDRWWKPVAGGFAALAAGLMVYQFGVVQPAKAKDARIERALTETLPSQLQTAFEATLSASESETATQLAETYRLDGTAAIAARDIGKAEAAIASLTQLQADLAVSYDVRVVYGPGEPRSGIFRIPDDAPNARNFYLIVEAVDPAGRLVEVQIESEEDRQTKRVSRWGQRVSESAFNAIASDKRDDQIIQNAVIGRKAAGQLTPTYAVATPGGAILEW